MTFLPWLHCLIESVPTYNLVYTPDKEFRSFAREALELERRQMAEHGTEKPQDIMAHLLAPLPNRQASQEIELTEHELVSDALILILGGSDTTTSTSIHMLWRLAQDLDVQETLFSAILAADPDPANPLSAETVAKIPYLEAFINETLRLHPPGATGLPRLVSEEGLQLEDGLFIPPHTNVSTPTYTLQRDVRNFSAPESFVPQRWMLNTVTETPKTTATSEVLLNRQAFIPFGAGPYGCPGKALAYLEMKMLIANLVRQFEIRYAEEADAQEIDRKMRDEWRDYITTHAAELPVRFVERSVSCR